MNRKQKITLSITGIILVTLILVGLTYGYYLTTIKGNTNTKSITTSLANLELKYDDGNGIITSSNLEPGDSVTKTFSVENTGNKKVVNYVVYLEDVINTFEDKNDLKLTLDCTSSINSNCMGNNTIYPDKDTLLVLNDIEVGEIQTYELKVDFIETHDDQSDNMNKIIEGNIVIKNLKETENSLETVSGTDNVMLDNPKLIKNFRIYGNSIQDGTPTPDTPVEIQSVGEKTKNLIDYRQFKPYGSGIITLLDNGIEYTGSYYVSIDGSYLIPGQTYIMSWNYESVDELKPYWRIKYTDITYSTAVRSGVSITIPTDKIVESVLIYPEITDTVHTTKLTNIQLEESTTPTEYEPYGYKIPVTVSGKNEFNYATLLNENYIDVIDETIGEFIFKKVSGIPNTYINAKQNTIYNISGFVNVVKQQSISIAIYYTDGSYSNITEYDTVIGEYVKFTGTSQANKTIDYIKFGGAGGLALETKFKEIQITETIEDKYEPYIEPVTTNIYLKEPLRKIGNYADYIDFANKKVVRNVNKVTDFAKYNWTYVTDYFQTTPRLNANLDNRMKSLCNYLQYSVATTDQCFWIDSSGSGLKILNVDYTDVENFKSWLEPLNIYVLYPLATPTEETIELPTISTNEGTNIIEVDTTISQSRIDIEYLK